MLIEIIAIFLLLLISAFFSSSETAITRVSDAKIHQKAEEGNKKAINTKNLLKDREKVIGALLLGNNAVNILASALTTSLFIAPFGDLGIFYATILMTILIFIFSEVLPKTYAIRKSEKLTLFTVPYISFLTKVLAPINIIVQILVSSILDLTGREKNKNDGRQNIRGAIILADDEGSVRKRDRKMLEGILDLSELDVDEIMTHRKNIESFDISEESKKIFEKSIKSNFSRIPIWEDNPDNIIGILHIKDLIRAATISKTLDIKAILQKPLFIPETTSLSKQLNEFRKSSTQIALVIDEYGVLQGLITMEDILEEIVGEIFDEFDQPSSKPNILEDGKVLVDGNMTVRDINRLMDWKIPDDEASTLSGLVIEIAQKLPKEREIIKRVDWVLSEVFDLFDSLGATEEQLDFPVLYASGRSGWASKEIDGPRENLHPLLDLIIEKVNPAPLDKTKPFAMLSTLLYADSFLGRSLIGRIAVSYTHLTLPTKA